MANYFPSPYNIPRSLCESQFGPVTLLVFLSSEWFHNTHLQYPLSNFKTAIFESCSSFVYFRHEYSFISLIQRISRMSLSTAPYTNTQSLSWTFMQMNLLLKEMMYTF